MNKNSKKIEILSSYTINEMIVGGFSTSIGETSISGVKPEKNTGPYCVVSNNCGATNCHVYCTGH